jgi:hypothetical protein
MQMLVLLQDAARGIAALHSKSVVHGDGAWSVVHMRSCIIASCTALT